MYWENFTPWSSLFGGLLIGLSASLLLWVHGKVAGISGILGNLLAPAPGDTAWRVAFVAGLLAAGMVGLAVSPGLVAPEVEAPLGLVAIAGLLVGFGTRLGNGCTSGHGVCGISRFSIRSLVAVLTFIATGALTVFVAQGL